MNPTSSSALPPDQHVRLQAIGPNRSFAVSAPAGSGKTGLLTQRVLQLLARCEQPEEVLAITFTRKAAGEMQERILHALWQAAEQPEPADPHAQRTWTLARAVLEQDARQQWNLLESPQRLRVTTIDSLCRSITQQLPLASGLGAQPETLEHPDLAYRMAVRELFRRLDQEGPLQDHLARLLRHLDNDLRKIEDLLAGLLAKREQWLGVLLLARHQQARDYFEAVLESVIREHLELVTERLQLHASELCAIADLAAQNLHREGGEQKNQIHKLLGLCDLPTARPQAMPQWLALTELLIKKDGEFRNQVRASEGFLPGKLHAPLKQRFAELIAAIRADDEAEALLAAIRELPPPRYTDSQWQLLESLTQILPQLVAELMLVFKQLAATDYSAISQAALLALGDEDQPSDLALQLDYRISHILVDEFQDTASPQLELLKKLTQGWQNGDGRTLFIVGDGMQSCYGFRNANVGLFLDARSQGIGALPLEPLDLQVNFRSQSGVVDWVNRVFLQAFPAQDDISRGAVRYSPSVAFKPSLDEAAVNLQIAAYEKSESDKEDSGAEDTGSLAAARHCEAQRVVELIQQTRAEHPQDSIAILVRTRSHLAQILPALHSAGLSFQATDIDRLANRMAIMDARSLTRALLDPSDRIAWLAILRAPWCGLPLEDLHQLANADLGDLNPRPLGGFPLIWPQLRNFTRITGLSTAGKASLRRITSILESALRERYRKPLRQWIKGTWLALGGRACLLDPADHENCERFFALLDQHEDTGTITDWTAFDQAMEQLFAAPGKNADALLQVMTIHKSKGLEFDHVIIPGLDRGNRADDKELLLWQERLDHHGEKQLLLGSFAPVGEEKDPLYNFMRSEAAKKQRFEATRLLYVGCTRAIKQLHLLACAERKEGVLKLPGKQTLLACIWPFVEDEARVINLRISGGAPSTSLPENTYLLRLATDWRMPSSSTPAPLSNYRGREFRGDATNLLNHPPLETRTQRLARHTGTLLHAALENMVLHRWIAENRQAQDYVLIHRPLWDTQLRQWGWTDNEIEAAIERIARALAATLADEQGRWLLDHRHRDSACELVLVEKDIQGVRESIIDRSFVDQGERWIIDYKSSEPEAQQSPADFIRQETAAYGGQLQRYRALLAAQGSEPIRTALYFASLGLLVELHPLEQEQ